VGSLSGFLSLPEADRTHPGAVTSPRVHSEDWYDDGLGRNEMKGEKVTEWGGNLQG
jgi:hypothetical protein